MAVTENQKPRSERKVCVLIRLSRFFGFSREIADQIGLSKRSIEMAVKIYRDLYPSVRNRLHGPPLAHKQTELKALSELGPNQQVRALDAILDPDLPEVGNVAQALEYLKHGTMPNPLERRFEFASRSFGALDDVMAGGGQGGKTGTGSSSGGNVGTGTVVRLYDGSTLMVEVVAAPGSNGKGGSVTQPGNRGACGAGGSWQDSDGRRKSGHSGGSGKINSRGWVDISSWADPKIQIIVGVEGTPVNDPGASAQPGIGGAVIYQTSAVADVRTDTVPIRPTFSGSFVKNSNAAGSFPDLGPGYGAGIWVIYSPSEITFNRIDPGDGNLMGPLTGRVITIISSKTPTYDANGGNPTIAYRYFAMGEI